MHGRENKYMVAYEYYKQVTLDTKHPNITEVNSARYFYNFLIAGGPDKGQSILFWLCKPKNTSVLQEALSNGYRISLNTLFAQNDEGESAFMNFFGSGHRSPSLVKAFVDSCPEMMTMDQLLRVSPESNKLKALTHMFLQIALPMPVEPVNYIWTISQDIAWRFTQMMIENKRGYFMLREVIFRGSPDLSLNDFMAIEALAKYAATLPNVTVTAKIQDDHEAVLMPLSLNS